MDGLCTGVETIVVRMEDLMGELRVDLTTLVRDSPCATCEELVNPPVADLTTAFTETSAASGAGSTPTGEIDST